MVFETF